MATCEGASGDSCERAPDADLIQGDGGQGNDRIGGWFGDDGGSQVRLAWTTPAELAGVDVIVRPADRHLRALGPVSSVEGDARFHHCRVVRALIPAAAGVFPDIRLPRHRRACASVTDPRSTRETGSRRRRGVCPASGFVLVLDYLSTTSRRPASAENGPHVRARLLVRRNAVVPPHGAQARRCRRPPRERSRTRR